MITPSRGLIPCETKVSTRDLEEFASVNVDCAEPHYTKPLIDCITRLANDRECEFVLLGSVATGKYVDCLLPVLGTRLLFPDDFVGRGDMSRGSLMLKAANSGVELSYVPA